MKVRPSQPHRCMVCRRMVGRRGFQVEWNAFGWTCLRWRCLKVGYQDAIPRHG